MAGQCLMWYGTPPLCHGDGVTWRLIGPVDCSGYWHVFGRTYIIDIPEC